MLTMRSAKLSAKPVPEPESDSAAPREFSVKELLEGVSGLLNEIFENDVWVTGVIHSYSESSAGHCYFSLCEAPDNEAPDNPGAGGGTARSSRSRSGGAPEYALSVALFKGTKSAIGLDFGQDSGQDFKLEDGLEVKIAGKIDIYKPRSQLQMVMAQIDAGYTTSKMANEKERLIAALKKEGVLELNKQREVAPIPLQVALITSSGSAAHRDFEDELTKSGFGWQVRLIHSTVQGAAAPAELVAALKHAAALKPDVVALIRGGGSAMDLAAFDNELVARTIIEMPVPVFSGIGHEIDVSVADLAAHTHTKTPTACAGALIQHMETAAAKLEQLSSGLRQETIEIVSGARNQLTRLAAQISGAPKTAIGKSLTRITSLRENLLSDTRHLLQQHQSILADKTASLKSLPAVIIKRRQGELMTCKKQIEALNPAVLLSRGWSITRTEGGKLVRSKKDAPKGTELITQVSDGKVRSTATEQVRE